MSLPALMQHPWLHRSLNLLFWALFTGFLGLHLYYHALILGDPNPLEYREGAALIPVHLLLAGKNPYALEYMPEATNVYGIVYPLMVYPFAQWLGPGLFTHRLVSALFIGASCLLLALSLRQQRVAWPYVAGGSLLLYQALLFFVGPLARPDATGLFYFLASLLIPVLGRYNLPSLTASLLLGILAFYTKLYFVLGLLFMGLYLLFFVSRRTGLLYSSIGLVCLFLSMFVVQQLLPTYFVSTLLISSNSATLDLSRAADHGVKHMSMQFLIFLKLYGVLALLALLGGYRCYRQRPAPCPGILALALVALSISTLLIYSILGRHDGNGLIYLLHLMLPPLILASLMPPEPSNKAFYALPLLIPIMLAHQSLFPALPTTQNCQAGWAKAALWLKEAQMALVSPPLSPQMLARGLRTHDAGQTIYFFLALPQRHPLDNVFTPGAALQGRLAQWTQALMEDVRQRRFDSIVLPTELFRPKDIEPYYQATDQTTVCMPPFQNWTLTLYKPN